MKPPAALLLTAALLAGCSGADFNTPTEPVSSAPGSHPPKPSPTAAYVRKPIRSVTPGVVLTRNRDDICTPGEDGGGNGPENVWPMTDHAQDERKDDLEDSLHRQICDGTITPAQAQRQLRYFWRHW